FFFQAEDGIRDFHVTGVQTCALPISLFDAWWQFYYFAAAVFVLAVAFVAWVRRSPFGLALRAIRDSESRAASLGYSVAGTKFVRSEERRVGKEGKCGGRAGR